MKYLYTTNPDKHCHEVAPGVWGRPTHTTEQPKLRKAGWVYHINELKEAGNGLRKDEEEGRKEEGEVNPGGLEEEDWAELYKEKFGKAPHHKMKLENIIAKVEGND